MPSRRDFERAIDASRSPGEKVAFLGALLAADSGLGDRLVVVGGSAISVYSGGAYVSKDIDVVGVAVRLTPSLRRWGFKPTKVGVRSYWVRSDLNLVIDIIDREDYVGLWDSTRLESTPYGSVRIAAVEDLIVRRLVFAKRERSTELLNQAVLLWVRFGPELDSEYLGYHVRFEGVDDTYSEMLRRAKTTPSG